MMKPFLIFLFALFASYSCIAQGQQIDLEQLTFKENAHDITQGHKRSADMVEPMTTLPAYTAYNAAGFHFGPVALGEDSFVSFVLNNVKEKKMEGIIVHYGTSAESKAIKAYLFKRYGKPNTIEPERQLLDQRNKPYTSDASYMWRNTRPGKTMFLTTGYHFEEGKPIQSADVIIINNDAKPSYESSLKTVLARIIKSLTP